MEEDNFFELFADFIHFYGNSDAVSDDIIRLENSEDIISDFLEMLNESFETKQTYRAVWLMSRYGTADGFKLLFEWINHGLATTGSTTKLDNLAKSQEAILRFLIENELIDREGINDLIKKLKRREIKGYPDWPRKFLEFHVEELYKTEEVTVQSDKISSELTANEKKITAKHHVLAYIFDCHANGISLLVGKKKELERIGIERIGHGKGNRFYKAFNEITMRDLNSKKNLMGIGGNEWREIVLELSHYPDEVEKYLQSKKL